MGTRSRFTLSLANKCRLLFGLAVLLIIAAALFVPGYRMESLVHEMNLRTIKQMVLAAYAHCDLPGGEYKDKQVELKSWKNKQAELGKWWPLYADAHQLPPSRVPELIKVEPFSKEMPEDISHFLQRCVTAMREHTDMNEIPDWGIEPDGGALYRYALAVRRKSDQKLTGIVTAWYKPTGTVEELWMNRASLVAAGGLAGLLALLVFYLISQKLILSPVRELRRVSEQVAGGDLSVRSKIMTGDDFEDLARAFNAMLAHLKDTQDELQDVNRSLDIKLDHLAHANVALFETNQLKSDFLANVSHELRTPMSSIIGFAELLKEALEGQDPRLGRYSTNILTSGRMLLDIINDLLDLAKIEAGKMEIRVRPLDLPQVCEDLIDFVRPLASKSDLDIELHLADGLPQLQSDPGKVKQILYNLLSNAIKFTPEGGRITLSARTEGDHSVRMVVADTGPGIDEEHIETIFDKFRQIDQSRTREHSGTGLGLAISSELATILGGEISVTSQIGVGSTFTVVLPIQAPQPAPEPSDAPVAVESETKE